MFTPPQGITDPRARRTRARLIQAIQELVLEGGLERLTHQAIAERSGIGRATVYRHFPERRDFMWSVLEVIDIQQAQVDIDMEHMSSDTVFRFLRWLADRFSDPLVRAFFLAIVSQAQHDEDAAGIARYRIEEANQIVNSITTRLYPDRWTTRAARLDVLAMLVGPVWMKAILMRQPVSDDFLHTLIANTIGPTESGEK